MAEKTLSEAEHKEQWRLSKEDDILYQLIQARCDSFTKKHLEKVAKKMVRLNLQLEDDPTEKDLNISEIHLQRIMSVKICPENTFMICKDKKQSLVQLPNPTITVSNWRDNHSKAVKILESCLYGESISVYSTLMHCVKLSRENFNKELSKQKKALEEGVATNPPNISVVITSKNSKPSLPKKSHSPQKKSLVLPEEDWTSSMLRMFLDQNAEIEKSIKRHSEDYKFRRAMRFNSTLSNKSRNILSRTLRARNYEKNQPINPIHTDPPSLNSVRTLERINTMPEILYDLEHPYFSEDASLEYRIKVIHSCIVIQKLFTRIRVRKLEKIALVIQRHARAFLAKRKVFLIRTKNFRRMFLYARLKHWYPVLVARWRELKSNFKPYDLLQLPKEVVTIQRFARGYITRKTTFYWKKKLQTFREAKRTKALCYGKADSINSMIHKETKLSTTQNLFEELEVCRQLINGKLNKEESEEILEFIDVLENKLKLVH